MRDEIKRRRFFFTFNVLLTLLFAIFIWTNDFFYPRNITFEGDRKKSPDNYTLQLPSYVTAKPLPPADSTYRPIEDSILKRLNIYRKKNKIPLLKESVDFTEFARKLAYIFSNDVSKAKQTRPGLDAQKRAYLEFPMIEIRVSHDFVNLPADDLGQRTRDIADYWINRHEQNGLSDQSYQKIGIGVLGQKNVLYAVLILVEPLFYYDREFPICGNLNISASIDRNQLGKQILLRRIHYKRGWLNPVKEDVFETEIEVNNDRVNIKSEIPKTNWSRIVFVIDGEEFSSGRAVSGKPVPSKRPLAVSKYEAVKYAEIKKRIVAHINQSRNSHGLQPVALDIKVSIVGDLDCDEMVHNGYFGHIGLSGSKPYHRYNLSGAGDGHVVENIYRIISSAPLPVNSDELLKMAKVGHDRFMAEVPPKDGHKKTILEPNHNYVGIGLSIHDNRFAYCEEFLDQYIEIDTPRSKTGASSNNNIIFAGKVLDPKNYGLYFVWITYDRPLIPLKNPKSQAFSYLDRSDQEVISFPPWKIKGTGNDYNVNTGKCKITFTPQKAGLYYILFYLRNNPSSIPYSRTGNVQVSTRDGFLGGTQVIDVL